MTPHVALYDTPHDTPQETWLTILSSSGGGTGEESIAIIKQNDPVNETITKRYITIFKLLKEKKMNRVEISKTLNVPTDTIKRDIKYLSKVLITSQSPPKIGGYVFTDELNKKLQ